MPAPTPLESCRALLERVYAAAGNRALLAAVYADTIGHDPFADDADTDPRDVLVTLEWFVREWAVSLGVHWTLVERRAFAVDGSPFPFSTASMLAANNDAPEVCDWVRSAQPGDVLPGIVTVACVSIAVH
jgi:hypothetical protein